MISFTVCKIRLLLLGDVWARTNECYSWPLSMKSFDQGAHGDGCVWLSRHCHVNDPGSIFPFIQLVCTLGIQRDIWWSGNRWLSITDCVKQTFNGRFPIATLVPSSDYRLRQTNGSWSIIVSSITHFLNWRFKQTFDCRLPTRFPIGIQTYVCQESLAVVYSL